MRNKRYTITSPHTYWKELLMGGSFFLLYENFAGKQLLLKEDMIDV